MVIHLATIRYCATVCDACFAVADSVPSIQNGRNEMTSFEQSKFSLCLPNSEACMLRLSTRRALPSPCAQMLLRLIASSLIACATLALRI